jgi:hypothetical protein
VAKANILNIGPEQFAFAIMYLLLESWRVEISTDDERQITSRHLQSNDDLVKRKQLWTDAA